MVARAVLVVALVVLAGCPVHMKRNAPGRIDVLAPPAHPEQEVVEKPGDPGEHVVLLTYGGFVAVGGRIGGEHRFANEMGVEVGVQWGDNARSHSKGEPIVPMPEIVIPQRRRGFNIGWALGEADALDSNRLERGPIYVEYAESRFVYGWTAGYGIDPTDGSHGPHVAVNGFGYYAKAGYRTERGFEMMLGLALKLPQSWVWSR